MITKKDVASRIGVQKQSKMGFAASYHPPKIKYILETVVQKKNDVGVFKKGDV